MLVGPPPTKGILTKYLIDYMGVEIKFDVFIIKEVEQGG
jgi:hypothetical protein